MVAKCKGIFIGHYIAQNTLEVDRILYHHASVKKKRNTHKKSALSPFGQALRIPPKIAFFFYFPWTKSSMNPLPVFLSVAAGLDSSL